MNTLMWYADTLTTLIWYWKEQLDDTGWRRKMIKRPVEWFELHALSPKEKINYCIKKRKKIIPQLGKIKHVLMEFESIQKTSDISLLVLISLTVIEDTVEVSVLSDHLSELVSQSKVCVSPRYKSKHSVRHEDGANTSVRRKDGENTSVRHEDGENTSVRHEDGANTSRSPSLSLSFQDSDGNDIIEFNEGWV